MNFSLRQGATIVCFAKFKAQSFVERLACNNVSVLYVAPPIILSMLKNAEFNQHDLSRLKVVLSGAAPLSDEVAAAYASEIGHMVTQGYGLTEASPATHLTPRDSIEVTAGSVGYLIASTQAKLLDVVTGEELGIGREGEPCISGPQIMKVYLNKPEATSGAIDEDGYLHTGDIAQVNDLG